MKKFNLYYIISTVTLVFMLFIFYQTLQLRGWFEEDSLAERLHQMVPGEYRLHDLNSPVDQTHKIEIFNWPNPDASEELLISLDSLIFLRAKVSDFEDEQVLVVIFQLDSSGVYQRLEGCELLLADDEAGRITGGSIGDFCGLNAASTEYLVLKLQLDRPDVLLQIESRRLDDQLLIKRDEYLLERLDSQ
ncbi:MAG: hypothetical protein U9Q77_01150 [Candidatus Marinimicrobia bacterium]|nr:hypothetical protein [Candidatus Neomarinimicrobiota bacterium]